MNDSCRQLKWLVIGALCVVVPPVGIALVFISLIPFFWALYLHPGEKREEARLEASRAKFQAEFNTPEAFSARAQAYFDNLEEGN
jgi:hypothetical protein